MKCNRYLVFNMYSFENPIVQDDLGFIVGLINWQSFENKTILITGANGHIASYLSFSFAYAIQEGFLRAKIIVNSRNKDKLESLYYPFLSKEWFSIICRDISELCIDEENIDYIFHFAGNASPHFIKLDPVGILKANIEGTFNVCKIAAKLPDCKIIYSSSREVYGENAIDNILTETSFGKIDPLDDRSCYPESKRAAETIIKAYSIQYGVKYAIARIAHCFGPGMKLENDGRVLSDFINDAAHRRNIVLLSSGNALRSFCYISDVIRGLLLIAANKESGAFNLSNEIEEKTILEIATMIAGKVSGVNVEVKAKPIDTSIYTSYPRRPLDCSRLYNLGWSPLVSFNEGIDRTLKTIRLDNYSEE